MGCDGAQARREREGVCGKHPLKDMRDDTMVDISTQRATARLAAQCDAYRFDPLRRTRPWSPNTAWARPSSCASATPCAPDGPSRGRERDARDVHGARRRRRRTARPARRRAAAPTWTSPCSSRWRRQPAPGWMGAGRSARRPCAPCPHSRSAARRASRRTRPCAAAGFGKGTQHEHDTLGAVSGRHDYPHKGRCRWTPPSTRGARAGPWSAWGASSA